MKIIEVYKTLALPVKSNVKKGDRVLILTDTFMDEEIYQTSMMACLEVGAHPILMMVPAEQTRRTDAQVPGILKKIAGEEIDFIIIACSTSFLGHKDDMRLVKEKVRTLSFSGRGVETMLEGSGTADWDEVQKITDYFAEAISSGSQVHVTSPSGTDVTFSVKGRSAKRLMGYAPEHGDMSTFPSGEAACAPVEGSTRGIIAVDVSMHQVGFVKEPIILVVRDGRVEEINGGAEAETLRSVLERDGDENSYAIAEFAMGSNPKARLVANTQEAKRRLGTVHFAIGDNISLGGTNRSKTHLDGVVNNVTVTIDGKKVLEKGKPCW